MKNIRAILALGAAGILLAACSQANSGPPTLQTVPNGSSAYSKLQFAVGTANLNGTVALNVVSTLRQPNGDSADLVDSPSITLPFSLSGQTAGTAGGPDGYSTAYDIGPSPSEIGGNALTSTPQTMHLGAPVCPTAGPGCHTANVTTFGLSGGVFGMGLQPANNTINSTAYSYTPYPQPIFSTGAVSFSPWGGPPAFDDNTNGMGTRDGLHNLGAGLLGWNDGITIFQFPGVAANSMTGQYTMSVVIPTGGTSTSEVTANANLNGATVLPAVTAPALTADGNGGGTFSNVVLPAGATEGYLVVEDLGPCPNGSADPNCQANVDTSNVNCQGTLGTTVAPVYYTIEVVPGTTTYTLPDTIGPNTTQNGPSSLTPSMSLCTAAANVAANGNTANTPSDEYKVQFFAMDYPLYEASYPKNKQQAPALVGAAGQDDITVSPKSAVANY